jgi:hypothetical protein
MDRLGTTHFSAKAAHTTMVVSTVTLRQEIIALLDVRLDISSKTGLNLRRRNFNNNQPNNNNFGNRERENHVSKDLVFAATAKNEKSTEDIF